MSGGHKDIPRSHRDSNSLVWPMVQQEQQQRQRVVLLREIDFEISLMLEEGTVAPEKQGSALRKALLLNISSGGILLLMEGAPRPEQVLKIQVPTAINTIKIPTLAEVRWVRSVPFLQPQGPQFVGLKFLF